MVGSTTVVTGTITGAVVTGAAVVSTFAQFRRNRLIQRFFLLLYCANLYQFSNTDHVVYAIYIYSRPNDVPVSEIYLSNMQKFNRNMKMRSFGYSKHSLKVMR